jgi:hypothetical protein
VRYGPEPIFRLTKSALRLALLTIGTLGTPLITTNADDLSRSALLTSPSKPRYIHSEPEAGLRFTPVTMADGSRLTLIAPNKWVEIADDITAELTNTHQQLASLLGAIPPFRSSVRLMDEPAFYELTGAPSWTNAMFFRGEIIIPLSTNGPIDLENLRRSVKHEYSHAVLSALSGGLIPGWLDEGLAQWIEGEENPALRNSLRSYLSTSEPVSLALLQGGFTKLTPRMVPAAYAQSLIAVQALLKAYGIDSIANYLRLLRDSVGKEAAFEAAFGVSEVTFESRLHDTLRVWAGVQRPTKVRQPVRIASAPVVPDRATRSALSR